MFLAVIKFKITCYQIKMCPKIPQRLQVGFIVFHKYKLKKGDLIKNILNDITYGFTRRMKLGDSCPTNKSFK